MKYIIISYVKLRINYFILFHVCTRGESFLVFTEFPFFLSEKLEMGSGLNWWFEKQILLLKLCFIPTLLVLDCPKLLHTHRWIWLALLCDFLSLMPDVLPGFHIEKGSTPTL